MDILSTNPYSTKSAGNTYGVQGNIKDYFEKQQRIRQTQKTVLDDQEVDESGLDMSDPLYTNKIDDGIDSKHEQSKTYASLNNDPVLLPGGDVRSSVAFEPVAITPNPLGQIGLRAKVDPITGAQSAGRQIYEKG